MKYVVNAKEMKSIDQYTIEKLGIPSLVLMEQAARAVVREIRKTVPVTVFSETVSLILCGMGNNGADGLAVARMLHILGGNPVVYITGTPEQGTEEWNVQYQIIKNLKIPVCDEEQTAEMLKGDRAGLIVDALFGIGLTRGIVGEPARIIALANESRALRVAVDLPSGVLADTGQIVQTTDDAEKTDVGQEPDVLSPHVFQADVTVTFGSLKFGCILYPGAYYCKKVVVARIGFPREAYDFVSPRFFTLDYPSPLGDLNQGFRNAQAALSCRDRLRSMEVTLDYPSPLGDLNQGFPFLLPSRPAHGHKGTFGKLTVIAGSVNMSGAALLAARAACRMGVGLVRIVTPEQNRIILQTGLPEAILTTYDTRHFSEEPVLEAVRWADAVVMGPGMGISGCTRAIVAAVLRESRIPMVLDADALRLIGDSEEWKLRLNSRHVVTPHPGEMAALSGHSVQEIERDPVMEAREFSHIYETNCVLKGARTVVARRVGKDYINTTGNAGMATAGAGDVLTGIIGSLLAQGMNPFDAACAGVLFHGLAGDLAVAEKGERALMASDLIDALSRVCREFL